MAEIKLEPGLTIHYLETNPNGDPVILLLHGLGATGDSWQLQLPQLSEAGYRCLAPDMRGFGRSTFPGGRNNSEIMAADTIKFLQKLKIKACHIIGISMGGTIALQVVLKNTALVESLILTNTFSKLRPQKAATWFFYGIRLILVHVFGIHKQANYVANRLFPRPENEELRIEFTRQVRQANHQGYRSTLRSYARYDLSEQVRKINIPTLIVTGEDDPVVPPAVQTELTNQIPNSRQVLIPNAGHAVSVERPNMYNGLILDFLKSQ
jgi:pimeloyl-ACP methyl ester carboxylesterase